MIRVVVAEDHPVVRHGLAQLMAGTSDLECVGAAGDGAAAVDLVESLRPDVLLLDLSLPGTNGLTALRAIRATGSTVRVLVLTSFADPDTVLGAFRAGADGYVLKESEAASILDAVRQVAAGRAPIDPSVAAHLLAGVRTGDRGALSEREREVLDLVRQGATNRVIARRLAISEATVKVHVSHILQRIGAADRTEAAVWAERHLPRDGRVR